MPSSSYPKRPTFDEWWATCDNCDAGSEELSRLAWQNGYLEAVRNHDIAMRALTPAEQWELNGPLDLDESRV
jgi:hypothetical protein